MGESDPPRDNIKPVIGLLGAPGSGKSTAARAFAGLRCAVIDADRLAHDALQSDEVRKQLRVWWGDEVFDQDGGVNRSAIGQIVFNDAHALEKIEALIHPIVHAGRRRERASAMADDSVVAIVEDCPLLLETGREQDCDALVLIDSPFEVRLARVSKSRGWDAAELQKREERQTPLDIKRRSADYVISNGETNALMHEQAESVLHQVISNFQPGPR